ncbi:hypothetical protein [Streptomyces sp. NBC_00286]|uniref:hypothetical protein n=1 Tax=Streptomyces sp. NBC_00286 TaxID=2975701 RepID=UPI002E2BA2DF|nr:hypothetical protein [Streptomyces sp. NBC_00286]
MGLGTAVAWSSSVLANSLTVGVRGEQLSGVVPSLTSPDGWLVLLVGTLVWAGRTVGASWVRSSAVAALMAAAYAGAFLLLPS